MTGENGENSRAKRRTLLLLTSLVVVMFGFGFAMVPLYSLFCKATGTPSVAQLTEIDPVAYPEGVVYSGDVDQSRWVTVKFDTTVHPNLPWEFSAKTTKIRVHPGKIYAVDFDARNRSSNTVTGQAIPSIAPWQATAYFTKLECFCFHKQTLTGNQKAVMPLRFMVMPELPKDIHSLTLSYSFMRLKQSDGNERQTGSQARLAVIRSD
jgi:cytochrome c oxidase assembly protein subunit 11